MKASLKEINQAYPDRWNLNAERAMTCLIGTPAEYRDVLQTVGTNIASSAYFDTANWRRDCDDWAFRGKRFGATPAVDDKHRWVVAFLLLLMAVMGVMLIVVRSRRRTQESQAQPASDNHSHIGSSDRSVVTFELSEDDFVAAQMFTSRRRKRVWVFYLVNSAAFAIVGFILAFTHIAPYRYRPVGLMLLSWLVISSLMIAGVFYFVTPWVARRRFKENKMLHGRREISWSSDAFTVTTSYGTSSIPWSDFYGYNEDNKVFFIFTSPAVFLLIPKRAMSMAQLNDLRSLAREKVRRA